LFGIGRYGCQNDGLGEADTMMRTRKGRREGRKGGRDVPLKRTPGQGFHRGLVFG